MNRIEHENVMKLVDCHEDNENVYLVMPRMIDDFRSAMNIANKPFNEEYARKVFH